MINYDKLEIRKQLDDNLIFELLDEFSGEPEFCPTGIIAKTICHNSPLDTNSRKLYYYSNTQLFHCYTGCEEPSFDIFELVRKVAKIQWNEDFDLNDAVRWVALKFGIMGRLEDEQENLSADWKILANYERIQEIEVKMNHILLKEYDSQILSRFNYTVKLDPWLHEGIAQGSLDRAQIGFYPGGDQITIPHFDKDGRFIGLRGRTLCAEEGERYGKYRPLKINSTTYNHPLGLNLYNLNNSKDNIALMQKAIVFEGEKSTLLYQSYFGAENDISVASCGSNLSAYQVQLLLEAGAREIVIAFDKQFEALNTDLSKQWSQKLTKLHNKYKNEVLISFLWDKQNTLNFKSSPIDEGAEKFLQLFKERIIL